MSEPGGRKLVDNRQDRNISDTELLRILSWATFGHSSIIGGAQGGIAFFMYQVRWDGCLGTTAHLIHVRFDFGERDREVCASTTFANKSQAALE